MADVFSGADARGRISARRFMPFLVVAMLLAACGSGGGGTSDPGAETDAVQPADLAEADGDAAGDAVATDQAFPDPGATPDDGPADPGTPADPGAGDAQSPDCATDAPGADLAIPDTTIPDGTMPDTTIPDPGAPATCASDAACDDGDPCTQDTCTAAKVCAHSPACVAGIDCFSGSCSPAGTCAFAPMFSDACWDQPATLVVDFEKTPLDGWSIEDVAANQPAGAEVVWHGSTLRAHSGARSLHLGHAASPGYSTGLHVASRALGPATTPKGGTPLVLVFWIWADVEDGDLWDQVSVKIETVGGQSVPVWYKAYGFPMRVWVPVRVDISAFAGAAFRPVFDFDSVDDSFNEGEGVYIDDVNVLTLATSPACASAATCDDGIPCTTDQCVHEVCVHTLAGACCSADAECGDNDACTFDVCDHGGCLHVPVADPLCCNSGTDCNDNIACTSDTCTANRCVYKVLATEGCCSTVAQCDDQDPCTKDQCEAFACIHVNTCCLSDAECDDNDDKCTTDSCVAGKCRFESTGAAGCCVPEMARFGFDDNATWELSDPVDGVGWHVVTGQESVSQPGALYYGNPSTWDFDNGEINGGSALSPIVAVPAGFPAAFEARLWMDTESSSGYDRVRVFVVSDGLPDVEVWTKGSWIDTEEWFKIDADLSAWAGSDIRLRIDFSTVDDTVNEGKGVFIDDILLTTTCLPRTCESEADCSDDLSETTEACTGGQCTYEIGADG